MADSLTLLDAPSFLGGISTDGDAYASDERPTSFRQKILQLFPNGMAPLTAITSVMKNEKTTDPQFSWWEKQLPLQGGTAVLYNDEALSDQYSSGDTAIVAGQVVYVKMAEAAIGHFRKGHQVVLKAGYSVSKAKTGKVLDVVKNGANSYLVVKMIQADPSKGLVDTDYVGVIGNLNPEGSFIPDVIGYKPEKYFNYTQIFRNPFQITRTARQTQLRTRDPWVTARQEQLMLHGLDIERALFWGERFEDTSGDEPERGTRGIINWIAANAPENLISFRESTETDFDGTAWNDTGIQFVERYLEHMFQYGGTEKMCLCGSGFLRGINVIAREWGHINIQTGQTSFGIKVQRWETPYGTVYFKTHPLFARNETDRWMGVFIQPENLVIRTIQDTVLKNDNGEDVAGLQGYDGRKEEYLAELGLELHHAKTFMVWSGVGLNHENYTP